MKIKLSPARELDFEDPGHPKLNASAENSSFNGTGPQKLSSGAGESLIFMFFLFFRKKRLKNVIGFCEH